MTTPIPLNLAFEDELTESVMARVFLTIRARYATRTVYNRGGHGYLRQRINGFNLAAKGIPFLVVTDLNAHDCPPALINDWLTSPQQHNLILRVAVTEIEAWILADRAALATFLGVRQALIPTDVESIRHPKEKLIEITRRSPRRELREDICPPRGSTRRIGPNYNGRLARFVIETWDPVRASQQAVSLRRTIARLTAFQPIWPAEDVPR